MLKIKDKKLNKRFIMLDSLKKYNSKDLLKITLSRLGLRNPFNKMFKVIEFETTAYCNRKCNYF